MTEVVNVRFKSCGKNYYFSPEGLQIKQGEKIVVETAKGIEMAECTHPNHMVEDTAVIQPLRPVIRIATPEDLDVCEKNKSREKEAFGICREKIADHGLDMKLVDVEYSFEGNKITFFFTSDGRVDFRELVKDLASVFHNRIELRQIGVRDEARLIGGIGICGRPYCCGQFLEDFAPVSTKMAKVQSLSLNPTKISGSCGRLMCCLRYEEEAYEELLKNVPKQGAYVETADGFGTALQIDLLRQTVKVKLDSDPDDSLRIYKAAEVAAVPGGRPKDGEEPAHILNYMPIYEEEDSADLSFLEEDIREYEVPESAEENKNSRENGRSSSNRKSGYYHKNGKKDKNREAKQDSAPEKQKNSAENAPAKSANRKPGKRRYYHGNKKPKGGSTGGQ